jgi:hypothetical protein
MRPVQSTLLRLSGFPLMPVILLVALFLHPG